MPCHITSVACSDRFVCQRQRASTRLPGSTSNSLASSCERSWARNLPGQRYAAKVCASACRKTRWGTKGVAANLADTVSNKMHGPGLGTSVLNGQDNFYLKLLVRAAQ